METQPHFRTKSKKIHYTVRQAHSAVSAKIQTSLGFPSQAVGAEL